VTAHEQPTGRGVPHGTGPHEQTLSSELVHAGPKLGLREDRVAAGGAEMTVDYLVHPGGVAVVALDPARDRVLLVRQFRRPVGASLWQLPMGFRDRDDEPAEDAARRELAEETGGTAARWERLADLHPSPGVSSERVTVFVADGVRLDRPTEREPGEAGMEQRWWPVAEALSQARSGGISCGITVASLLLALG
jgi:8-oxo-dGDP phosphatase